MEEKDQGEIYSPGCIEGHKFWPLPNGGDPKKTLLYIPPAYLILSSQSRRKESPLPPKKFLLEKWGEGGRSFHYLTQGVPDVTGRENAGEG